MRGLISSLSDTHGFKHLTKGVYTHSRIWRVARADWRGMIKRLKEVNCDVEIPLLFSSQRCFRCGCINRDLRGAVFECGFCGLRIDRQLNAAIDLYLKMEGAAHERGLRDKNILPTPVGGCFQTGVEQKAPYELVRELYDVVKPSALLRIQQVR